MGTSPEQARQTVVATRGRLEANTSLLAARLRYELDPRQRLRRDGVKLAAGLAVVVLVGTVYVVRARRRKKDEKPVATDWIADMPQEWRERLEELLAEAADRGDLSRPSARSGRGRSLATNLALRAARMAAPVVVSAAAERIGRRQAVAAAGRREV
ncbi:MAG: hypothetical protein WBA31_04225 [Candidatus Dormiibacterota bacterium]